MQQATCQFGEAIRPGFGSDIAWHQRQGPSRNDVDDVPGLSEPHGPHGAMADRGRACAEISQPRPARHLRQTVRAARGRAGTDLAHFAHLYAPCLRYRQGAGGQSGAGGDRGSRLRDAVRFAPAFQEAKFTGTTAHAAGGADVRPLRDAVARHREDAIAGSRRLHHRLAQPARHSPRPRQIRPRRIYRAPHRLSRSAGSARAHGGDLPAVGIRAGGSRHHVGG